MSYTIIHVYTISALYHPSVTLLESTMLSGNVGKPQPLKPAALRESVLPPIQHLNFWSHLIGHTRLSVTAGKLYRTRPFVNLIYDWLRCLDLENGEELSCAHGCCIVVFYCEVSITDQFKICLFVFSHYIYFFWFNMLQGFVNVCLCVCLCV